MSFLMSLLKVLAYGLAVFMLGILKIAAKVLTPYKHRS